MANVRRVPGMVIGFAVVIAVVIAVTIIPVGAQTSPRSQPVTVTNTPLPVTAGSQAPVTVTGEVSAAAPVSFDGFRDGFAVSPGGSAFVEFPAIYASLIVISHSEDDDVDLSFFFEGFAPRFTLSGAPLTLPLAQPVALDAVGVDCAPSNAGECDFEVAILGTAAA